MSTVSQDVHDLAGLARAFRVVHIAVPAAGLRKHRSGRLRANRGARLQRPIPLAGSVHRAPLGSTAHSERVLLVCGHARSATSYSATAHHPCLGFRDSVPYSAHRGKKSVNRHTLDDLKQQIPLMGYLQAHDWHPVRPLSRGRWMGLCPLHGDHNPSFLVDPNKDLFYCYGCGRGGDVIRFAELYHQVKFSQALALLRQWRGAEPVLHEVASFYRIQLHRHSEAVTYLYQRGIHSQALIEHMRIGYAPGGCLRGWLTQLGHSLPTLRQAGLVTGVGYDAYVHRIVFPLEGNLYGRSISAAAPPHRFLPGAKGGLYAWAQAQSYPEVILVEGLFDYAVLWQAGFHNVTCSLGTQLNARQFRQLCDGSRTVYLAFDADSNGSGSRASQCLSRSLRERGIPTRLVSLPEGHDPNSFFIQGGEASQFRSLLEAARP
jgi:DNA primase